MRQLNPWLKPQFEQLYSQKKLVIYMLNIFRTQILSLCNSNPVYNFLEC